MSQGWVSPLNCFGWYRRSRAPARRSRSPRERGIRDGRSRRSPCLLGLLELLVESEVAVVARGAHLASLDGLAHRAPGLHAMSTVGEAAVAEERPELDEAAVELGGRECPYPYLANSGGVHHESAPRQRVHVGTDG